MTQHKPHDTLKADLEALAKVFEAEDREDRRKEAQRRRDGLPEPNSRASRTVGRLPGADRLIPGRERSTTRLSRSSPSRSTTSPTRPSSSPTT